MVLFCLFSVVSVGRGAGFGVLSKKQFVIAVIFVIVHKNIYVLWLKSELIKARASVIICLYV